MPTYAFKCGICNRLVDNRIMPISHTKDDVPECCGVRMGYHITHAPNVHWKDPMIEPFRHVAIPGKPVVTSMKEHRELMARHDMVDASDMTPPSHEEQREEVAKMEESIQAISPTAEQKSQLQEQGLDSILD